MEKTDEIVVPQITLLKLGCRRPGYGKQLETERLSMHKY
jgi:hypothetical protein